MGSWAFFPYKCSTRGFLNSKGFKLDKGTQEGVRNTGHIWIWIQNSSLVVFLTDLQELWRPSHLFSRDNAAPSLLSVKLSLLFCRLLASDPSQLSEDELPGDLQSLSWLTSVDVPRLQQMASGRMDFSLGAQNAMLQQTGTVGMGNGNRE